MPALLIKIHIKFKKFLDCSHKNAVESAIAIQCICYEVSGESSELQQINTVLSKTLHDKCVKEKTS